MVQPCPEDELYFALTHAGVPVEIARILVARAREGRAPDRGRLRTRVVIGTQELATASALPVREATWIRSVRANLAEARRKRWSLPGLPHKGS